MLIFSSVYLFKNVSANWQKIAAFAAPSPLRIRPVSSAKVTSNYEIRDAYSEEILDAAAIVLAEKIAAILIEKAMDKAIGGGSLAGSRLADNLPTTTIAKPITVGESTPNVDTSTNTANNVPEANGNGGEIPRDAQANGNGNANGGFQAGQNQGGKPNDPNLLPPGGKKNGNGNSDADKLRKLKGIPWGKCEPSGCEKVAIKIRNAIGGDIYRITPAMGVFLPPLNGTTTYWDIHEVVVKDGRVYDAFTGPEGMTIAEYKQSWGEYSDVINFGF